jgi:hypothetical protein
VRNSNAGDANKAVPEGLRADVESLLLAHQVAPGESLAVRLLGMVGPDGSWALEDVLVRHEGDRVILVPRVRHTPGVIAVQMLVPLDRIVRFPLEPGRHVVEVQGRERTLRETVVVRRGAHRPAPTTEIHVGKQSAAGGVVPIEIVGTAGDGFVARIEWRPLSAPGSSGAAGVWREAQSMRTEGASLQSWLELRPEDARSIEARAVDGQGDADPAPAIADLR